MAERYYHADYLLMLLVKCHYNQEFTCLVGQYVSNDCMKDYTGTSKQFGGEY